jgi:hypothetical protein
LNFKFLFFFILEFRKFLSFMKFYENWNFRNFLKISEFSLIDNEVQVFRINIKLLSNPVAELKIRENDSHCRSIVLKTMDRSIVKQLKKEKDSNFNVENFVVMFVYPLYVLVVSKLRAFTDSVFLLLICMQSFYLWEFVIFWIKTNMLRIVLLFVYFCLATGD